MESGYRITLTYNLLLHGDTSRPEGDGGTVAELADLLREHFSTPVPRDYGDPRPTRRTGSSTSSTTSTRPAG